MKDEINMDSRKGTRNESVFGTPQKKISIDKIIQRAYYPVLFTKFCNEHIFLITKHSIEKKLLCMVINVGWTDILVCQLKLKTTSQNKTKIC